MLDNNLHTTLFVSIVINVINNFSKELTQKIVIKLNHAQPNKEQNPSFSMKIFQ